MGTEAKKGSKSHTPIKRKHDDSLMLVLPGGSGVGLPYAPVDWPNPGDVWSWRVGRRYNVNGFFQDRFLNAPERLQEKPTKKLTFPSKPSLERYLQSTFPETDIKKFYELFTWEIPADAEADSKGKTVPTPQVHPTAPEEVTPNGGTASKKSRKATPKKKGKASTKNGNMDLSLDVYSGVVTTPASSVTGYGLEETTYEGGLSTIDYDQEANDSLEKSQPTLTPEEFDSYLNCLDDALSRTLPTIDEPAYETTSLIEIRKKLTSLLAMGFTSLASSQKLNELTSLTAKLQNDPSLSSKEHAMLKLIQEIPFISKSFIEAKEVSLQAEKFFTDHEMKMGTVSALKNEYNSSKKEIEAAQNDEASTLVKILDIDQQLAKLQSQKQAMTEAAKAINKKINELASTQKRVMDRLPKIVQEVQLANSEKSQWEAKREKAAKQEAEILEKFAPLEGFSF